MMAQYNKIFQAVGGAKKLFFEGAQPTGIVCGIVPDRFRWLIESGFKKDAANFYNIAGAIH